MTVEAHKETLGFQAEVKQLLKLMIHSLYSNKEIFLRELISNASDAADKLRFEALSDDALWESDPELKIRVAFDKAARTITISDNGIGMNRQEVIEHIGTIAKSGTRQFFEALTGDQAKDAHLIGQFGVGFYSAFIVADKVTLITRRAGLGAEHGVNWESAGEGDYTLETVEKAGRGTDVILHLREGEDELLSSWQLKSIIRKYSDHITLPIVMKKEEWDAEKKETVVKDEDEAVNQASALWARPKSEITPEQYEEFYKHVAHDFEAPLAYVHAKVEGKQEYTQLLYMPGPRPVRPVGPRAAPRHQALRAPRVHHGRRQAADALLPALRARGDRLQRPAAQRVARNPAGKQGHRSHPRRFGEEGAGHAGRPGREPGGKIRHLLEGIRPRASRKAWARISPTRSASPSWSASASTHDDSEEQSVSLADYIGRMKEGQDKIYYVTADTFAAAKNSPHLEIFRAKGVEVLLLADRVDEWMVSHLTEFDGKKLQSVAKGDLDLGKLADEEEKKEQEQEADAFKGLTDKIKDSLGEQGQGSARHAPPDLIPGLPGGGRARHERQPGAPAQGGGPERADHQADPGNQPQARAGAAPEGAGRQRQVRRLEPHPVRPGAAGRRRSAGRSGDVRAPPERAVADDVSTWLRVKKGAAAPFFMCAKLPPLGLFP